MTCQRSKGRLRVTDIPDITALDTVPQYIAVLICDNPHLIICQLQCLGKIGCHL